MGSGAVERWLGRLGERTGRVGLVILRCWLRWLGERSMGGRLLVWGLMSWWSGRGVILGTMPWWTFWRGILMSMLIGAWLIRGRF